MTATSELHRYGSIIDGLNCAAVSREQMERTRAGGVSALNLTIISPWADFEAAMGDLGRTLERILEMRDLVTLVQTTEQIWQAWADQRIAIIMGAQNSALVENDLSLLRILFRLGFRVLQPSYNERNRLGDGAIVSEDRGLTELGREWVHEMNRLGMVIDLSHCGHRTSVDAIAESTDPCIISHANALALCNSPRNKPDEIIRAVAENGGVVGAVCWTPALKHASRPTIEDCVDQIEYIASVAGIEHVSFASDLSEGVYTSAEEWDKMFGPNGMYPTLTGVLGEWYTFDRRFPQDYESLAHTTRIWDRLVARGYSEDDVEKIMSGNLLRIFQEVWRA